MANIFSRILNSLSGVRNQGAEESLAEKDIPLQDGQFYSSVISQYIPYFTILDEEGKKKFVKRSWHFRQSKRFHFIGIREEQQMPVLISAAAAQLTFGLQKYKLDYFKDVYVMADAYQLKSGGEQYIGHVSPSGITISWKHFLQGYDDTSDNVNVAIHEMAHALEHSSFMSESGVDPDFKTDFEKLSAVFGPSVAGVAVHRRSYLLAYAYTNIQEFWAVSVEAFFENPRGLKDNMSELYGVIAEILNQDPLTGRIGIGG